MTKLKAQISKHLFWNLNFGFYFVIWILSFGFLYGCQNKQLYKDNRIMMGTFVEVTSPDKRAANIVFSEIKKIEGRLSKYKEDSEVSRLNKLGKLNSSQETLYIIKKAKEFWMISEGAFDITVGPLMDLWGFTDKQYSFPDEGQVKKTLELVGSDKIIFKDTDNVVEFSLQGMKIDLGAIAKGYALDCAVKQLKKAGIKSCLINAGGDIYCLGVRPWRIAIQNPRRKDFLSYYLDLKDKAVATSGDYEQYFIKDNKRYSHIFNPKTGYPADSGVISVTVIASDCLTADALATTIFVLGKAKGEELAQKIPGVEVRIIEEKGQMNR